jgi:signal peptidase I
MTEGLLVGSRTKAALRRISVLLTLILVIRGYIFLPVLVIGNSMLPTLHPGQVAVVNRLAYSLQSPQRGDVVVVRTGSELMIKRIVGLPGEEIALEDGFFYINGEPLQEPYVQSRGHDTIAAGKIAAAHFVVAGDNRAESLIAVVDNVRIKGRVGTGFGRARWQNPVPMVLPP